jgi:pyroglutamyl-peptidase
METDFSSAVSRMMMDYNGVRAAAKTSMGNGVAANLAAAEFAYGTRGRSIWIWAAPWLGETMALRILITTFEPYDQWSSNSSWDALAELLGTRGVPEGITTRRYPVDIDRMSARLTEDLERGFDAVLHLGQAPGTSAVHLETIALNVAGVTYASGDIFGEILPQAPVAYRTRLPLQAMLRQLHAERIPAKISYHAGTYLCNAVLYLSQHWHASRGLDCPVGFVHLPLTLEQVVAAGRDTPGLPKPMLAHAIGVLVDCLREHLASRADGPALA